MFLRHSARQVFIVALSEYLAELMIDVSTGTSIDRSHAAARHGGRRAAARFAAHRRRAASAPLRRAGGAALVPAVPGADEVDQLAEDEQDRAGPSQPARASGLKCAKPQPSSNLMNPPCMQCTKASLQCFKQERGKKKPRGKDACYRCGTMKLRCEPVEKGEETSGPMSAVPAAKKNQEIKGGK